MTEFRTAFQVTVTPAEAWKALEELQAEHTTDAGESRQWWIPGFESTGTELEVDPGRELTVRKDHWPCADTIIMITFDHVESGAQITIVQSGFDESFVEGSGEGFWIVCEHIAADLRLFFETGVIGGRHRQPWAPIGCAVVPTPLGLEITEVWDGTWAARAGLRRGDVLLILAGAPLTAVRDFITVQRIVGAGDELAAVWVRDRTRIEASLSL